MIAPFFHSQANLFPAHAGMNVYAGVVNDQRASMISDDDMKLYFVLAAVMVVVGGIVCAVRWIFGI